MISTTTLSPVDYVDGG